ncbi:MAG TPA: HipA domain-containing protein, partial [bacterium]|nr:HipA domain-containing protein [bacterium]
MSAGPNRCPITYQIIPQGERYSLEGLKKLSRGLRHLENLPLSAQEQRIEARKRATKMSIQGVQPKLSAKLSAAKARFEIVDTGGTFILKPPHELYPNLPENEDLSMHLAVAAGIEVPLHGLLYSKDGSRTYFIKRFDRFAHKGKIPVEDFAQLSGKTRETKYNSSMEQLAKVIDQFCTFPLLEKRKLLLRALFNFLIGNEDMHLKNYSLITRDGKIELAPAYDFLNSSIMLENSAEQSALPLRGKKRKLSRKDWIDYYALEPLALRRE